MPWGEQQLREDIVGAGRMMYERGWIAANDGNLTVRLDSEPSETTVKLFGTPTKAKNEWTIRMS